MATNEATIQPGVKISIVSELESGKPLAENAREHGIHPSLPYRWRPELAENPERAFAGNGNQCRYEARISELVRVEKRAWR